MKEIRAGLFKQQLDFIDDPAKLKTARCSRRAGKSYGGAGAYAVLEAIQNPGSNILYLGLTRDQIKRIMLKDIFKVLNKKHTLGMRINHTSLTITFPNGTVLYMLGIDSSPEDMDKILGQKFKLVIVDEAGSWNQDQKQLVHSILEPACADEDGTIALIGSPVPPTHTYFFQITYYTSALSDEKFVKGWSRHEWSWKDNPFVRDNMQRLIERKMDLEPRIVETLHFRNMYLNQWVLDLSSRCYKYSQDRNSIKALPDDKSFSYMVGGDLGFTDATAFVVWACSEEDHFLYIVKVIKKEKLDITGVAEVMWGIQNTYNPIRWVLDGASKQAVEELKNRHGFPHIEVADKAGKADIIEVMNSDFVTGRIKLVEGACDPLIEEYQNLIWDPKVLSAKVEHPGCPNHACDGGLYGWRKCFHSSNLTKRHTKTRSEDERLEEWFIKESEQAQKIQKRAPDFCRDAFGKSYGFH